MNVRTLHHDMERRGVRLEADGGRLVVDAPAGELSEQDRSALAEAKPVLLRMLTPKTHEEPADDGRRCDTAVTGVPNPLKLRGGGERRLVAAGWEPKERGGLVIWANPDTGFYCSQEVALHRLEAGQGAGFGTFATQKSAGVMGSGEGVADDPDGKP